MTRPSLLILFLVSLLASSSYGASPGGGGGFGAGLRLGIALPSPGSASLLMGLQAGIPLIPGFRTGAFLDRVSSGVEVKSGTSVTTASTGSWIFGGGAEYLFGASGIGAGLATGLQMTSSKVNSTDGTSTIAYEKSLTTPFLAPLMSYEASFGMLAVTAELRYLISFGDNPKIFSITPGVKLAL